jgi:hypothetical protein
VRKGWDADRDGGIEAEDEEVEVEADPKADVYA